MPDFVHSLKQAYGNTNKPSTAVLLKDTSILVDLGEPESVARHISDEMRKLQRRDYTLRETDPKQKRIREAFEQSIVTTGVVPGRIISNGPSSPTGTVGDGSASSPAVRLEATFAARAPIVVYESD